MVYWDKEHQLHYYLDEGVKVQAVRSTIGFSWTICGWTWSLLLKRVKFSSRKVYSLQISCPSFSLSPVTAADRTSVLSHTRTPCKDTHSQIIQLPRCLMLHCATVLLWCLSDIPTCFTSFFSLSDSPPCSLSSTNFFVICASRWVLTHTAAAVELSAQSSRRRHWHRCHQHLLKGVTFTEEQPQVAIMR